MDQVKNLIAENANSTRKTKNNDLYYKIVCGICEDDAYRASIVKSVGASGVVTEELNLCAELRRIFATFLKKNSAMTEAEAFETATNFKLTSDQAKTLANIIHEADYIMMKDCKKKVQMFNKPGFDITLSIGTAPESVRPNPQDRAKSVKIEAHDRLVVSQKIFDFQKKTIKTPKKK